MATLLRGLALAALLTGLLPAQDVEFCGGAAVCPGRNPKAKNFEILQQEGVRPRYSPDGRFIVFDRVDADGYFDVYLADRDGDILRSLTAGRPGIAQRNNGNAVFHPSGEYVVFVSQAAEDHYLDGIRSSGDPGIGLFSNLWATDLTGSRFWQLTDIPIKKSLLDGVPAMASVNPDFSPDGSRLVWTERFDEGGNHNWGAWRLKIAEWANPPALSNVRVLLDPSPNNYVTSMGFLDANNIVLAGNLDGQHEFGMDNYVYSIPNGTRRGIQDTPQAWEEGACVSPNGQYIAYMSNLTSSFPLDFDDPNWVGQPTEREYWLVKRDGSGAERLTYLNDPSAPEFLRTRTFVAACRFSPDGRYLAGTLGIDFGTGSSTRLQLKIFRIELADPSLFAGGAPAISQGGVGSAASFQPGIAPASWVAIFGENLASSTRVWSAADFVNGRLPTSLDGVSVSVNGKPAYVYFVSPVQVNVLTPADSAIGPVNVEIRTPSGATQLAVNERARQPELFRFAPQSFRYAAAVHPDGAFLAPPGLFPTVNSRAAKPGDIVSLYGTGFAGADPQHDPAIVVQAPVELDKPVDVRIGGAQAEVQFAGLVGSGLYQLNVVIPQIAAGDHRVTVSIDGFVSSGVAYVPVE